MRFSPYRFQNDYSIDVKLFLKVDYLIINIASMSAGFITFSFEECRIMVFFIIFPNNNLLNNSINCLANKVFYLA